MDKPPGADQNVFIRFFSDRGVRYRLAALVLSATEAIFLKRALLVTSPLMTFAVWAIAGFVFFVFMAFACCRRIEPVREVQLFQTHWPSYLALAATTGLMQLGTLVVLTGFQVAAALALFQTSILLTVFLGWKVFHEQHFTRRFLGALVMVGGAVLIIVSR
jgi:drug/metabolite transporter (DMT)-like permease